MSIEVWGPPLAGLALFTNEPVSMKLAAKLLNCKPTYKDVYLLMSKHGFNPIKGIKPERFRAAEIQEVMNRRNLILHRFEREYYGYHLDEPLDSAPSQV